MDGFLKEKSKSNLVTEKLKGDAAAKTIASGAKEADTVGFDETQAAFLKVKKGGIVSVTPQDTGKSFRIFKRNMPLTLAVGASHPTTGKLLALGKEEVVLEVQGNAGTVRVHLPRLGFVVGPAKGSKL